LYHVANKEKIAARVKVQRSADPEKYAAMSKRWCEANPDKVRARSAANYAANREKSIEYSKAWQKRNPEKVKLRNAAVYLSRDKEKVSVARAVWRAANPGKDSAWRKAWTDAHPENKRISHQNRKARKKASGGKLSQGLIAKLLIRQDGKCACCGKSLEDGYHLDHIMPLILGGPHADENMQLLTPRCNMSKGGQHPEEFKKLSESKIL
jgi:5-methylcytosine-specific restriction endonuclease McrA